MFDNVIISKELLPIDKEQILSVPFDINWQTKSFDCNLSDYYVNNEGQLLRVIGSFLNKEESIRFLINYTGVVNFYSNVGEYWFEFFADFDKGVLRKISYIKENY